jgi:hypothetical protein
MPGPLRRNELLDYDIRPEGLPRVGRVILDPGAATYTVCNAADQVLRRGRIGAVGDIALVVGEVPSDTALRVWNRAGTAVG